MIIIRIVNWNIPEEKKPQIRRIVRKGLIFLAILAGLFILTQALDISLDDILRYTPENPFLAALVMLAFYGLKSLTVFFPVPLLMIASGHLFSTGLALVVNFLGIAVATTIPYLLGRRHGESEISKFFSDSSAIQEIREIQTDNQTFTTYMLRMLQLPMDLVSMFLGTEHLNYAQYLIGTLTGMAPTVIATTVIGENISQPGSRYFWISLAVMIVIIVLSFLFFWKYLQKHYPEKLDLIMKRILKK